MTELDKMSKPSKPGRVKCERCRQRPATVEVTMRDRGEKAPPIPHVICMVCSARLLCWLDLPADADKQVAMRERLAKYRLGDAPTAKLAELAGESRRLDESIEAEIMGMFEAERARLLPELDRMLAENRERSRKLFAEIEATHPGLLPGPARAAKSKPRKTPRKPVG